MRKLLSSILLIPISAYSLCPNMPNLCPHVHTIKSVGISHHLFSDAYGNWYGGRFRGHYHMPQKWTFIIGPVTASNKQVAYDILTNAMTRLYFFEGPKKGPGNKYVCLYKTYDDVPAAAFTPHFGHPSKD